MAIYTPTSEDQPKIGNAYFYLLRTDTTLNIVKGSLIAIYPSFRTPRPFELTLQPSSRWHGPAIRVQTIADTKEEITKVGQNMLQIEVDKLNDLYYKIRGKTGVVLTDFN